MGFVGLESLLVEPRRDIQLEGQEEQEPGPWLAGRKVRFPWARLTPADKQCRPHLAAGATGSL